MTKQMAIIRGVGIGMRDFHAPILWFETRVSEGSGALQILGWEDAKKLIEESKVYEVAHLEGKPCWVESDGLTIKFLGIAKI